MIFVGYFKFLLLSTALNVRRLHDNRRLEKHYNPPLAVPWCSGFGGAHRGSTVGLLLLQRFRLGLAVEYSSCFISVMKQS